MILILWAGLASRSSGPWPGKGGCRNFQRSCRKSTSRRSSRKGKVRPACQSEGNGWLRQGSCHILQGLYFLPARRKSGSPTFTRRHLLQSILHTPPGSKTVVRCDQPCQGHQKQPPASWPDQAVLDRAHVWGCEPAEVGLCSERRCTQGRPHCFSAPALRNRWPWCEHPCWSGMFNIK